MSFGKLISQSEDLKSAGDYFLEEENLPNNTSATSDEFRCNDGLAGVAIVGTAETDIASGALKIELLHSDTSGDSSPSTEVLLDVSATAYSDGDELFRFVPGSNIGAFGKIKVTTQADKSSEKISVFVVGVANR